jgi:predicted phage terminase large subunit-like protein
MSPQDEPVVLIDEREVKQWYIENDPLYRATALGYNVDSENENVGHQSLEPEHLALLEHLETPDPLKMYLMPRTTFKSSLITCCYTIGRILRDRNLRVLIDSEVYRNSVRHLSEIKQHLVLNPEIVDVYGPLKGEVGWREDSIVMPGRTRAHREPTIDCAGLDVVKVGMHYDLIVADDLVSDLNVTSQEMRDKTWDHFQLLFSLLEPTGQMIIVGTRWHTDDMYGRIIKKMSERFKLYVRPAIQADGTLTFPKRLTAQRLDDLRGALGPWKFQALYQNNPVPEEGKVFLPEWIKYWESLPDPAKVKTKRLTTIDPAIGEDRKNDYTAMVTCDHDLAGNVWVVDVRRGRWNVEDQIKQMLKLIELYHPARIGIEEVAYQKAHKMWLQREFSRMKLHVPIEGLKGYNRAKEFRIERLQPLVQRGQLLINTSLPFQKDLEAEMLDYPQGTHDDLIDALAYQLEISPNVRYRPSKEKENWLSFLVRKWKKQEAAIADPNKWKRM